MESVFLIEERQFFRTLDHSLGWSEFPDYELTSKGFQEQIPDLFDDLTARGYHWRCQINVAD